MSRDFGRRDVSPGGDINPPHSVSLGKNGRMAVELVDVSRWDAG